MSWSLGVGGWGDAAKECLFFSIHLMCHVDINRIRIKMFPLKLCESLLCSI